MVEDGFTPYYASIVPGIKQILKSSKSIAVNSTASTTRNIDGTSSGRKSYEHAVQAAAQMSVCGKAMECIGENVVSSCVI